LPNGFKKSWRTESFLPRRKKWFRLGYYSERRRPGIQELALNPSWRGREEMVDLKKKLKKRFLIK